MQRLFGFMFRAHFLLLPQLDLQKETQCKNGRKCRKNNNPVHFSKYLTGTARGPQPQVAS
jgi:hypothetical protein